MTHWFEKKESIKSKSNQAENTVHRNLVSGAFDFFKGDFSTKDSCIDLKSTKFKSIRITTDMCEKLIKDALECGKINSILILDLPDYYITCKVDKKKG